MKIIWYSFYPADYARDTSHLSMIEHGAYRALMDHYYITGKPLPASALHLHRVCRAFASDEQDALNSVLHQFFTLTDEGWKHGRIEAELAKTGDISAKRRLAATLRHKGKNENLNIDANAGANAGASALQMDTHTHTHSQSHTQEQIQKKEKEKEKKEKPQAASATRSIVSKPDDVSDQTWTDWVAHRKAKKATVTETVLKSIQTEADKAGMNLEAALETMCARGWSGFKAEWVQPAGAVKSKANEKVFDEFSGDSNVIEFDADTGEWK